MKFNLSVTVEDLIILDRLLSQVSEVDMDAENYQRVVELNKRIIRGMIAYHNKAK